MSHEGSAPSSNVQSCRPRSRPRSRQPAIHDPQPTSEELARVGVIVRDFVYDTTLPPVRPVYRQPRQVQPSIPRQLQREDTEPVDESQSQSMGSRPTLGRTLIEPAREPVAGPSILRERGGFFMQCEPEINLYNSRPMPLNLEVGEHSIALAGVAQGPGTDVPTPTVTPQGSLRWDFKEIVAFRPNVFEGASLSRRTSSMHRISSGCSSPLTPLTPSPPQGSHLTSFNRSPSISSLHQQSPKRRKVVHEDLDSPPVVNRYFLRKRTRTLVTGSSSSSSPSKRLQSAHTPATPLVRTASMRPDHSRKRRNVEAGPSARPRGGSNMSQKGRQRRT